MTSACALRLPVPSYVFMQRVGKVFVVAGLTARSLLRTCPLSRNKLAACQFVVPLYDRSYFSKMSYTAIERGQRNSLEYRIFISMYYVTRWLLTFHYINRSLTHSQTVRLMMYVLIDVGMYTDGIM